MYKVCCTNILHRTVPPDSHILCEINQEDKALFKPLCEFGYKEMEKSFILNDDMVFSEFP